MWMSGKKEKKKNFCWNRSILLKIAIIWRSITYVLSLMGGYKKMCSMESGEISSQKTIDPEI